MIDIQGFSFPFEFGFIPSTLSEDGDPMDIIVLADEPTHVGCLLPVHLLGAIKVEQTSEGKRITDPRLVGVPVKSFDFGNVQKLGDLPHDVAQQIEEFLALYNKNSGTQDKVTGACGAEEAMDLLEEGAGKTKNK
jgi:inorganic pyrophosphatase